MEFVYAQEKIICKLSRVDKTRADAQFQHKTTEANAQTNKNPPCPDSPETFESPRKFDSFLCEMGEDVGSHNFAFLMTEVVHQKKRDYLNYELDFVGRKFNENSKNFINLKDKNVNEEIYKDDVVQKWLKSTPFSIFKREMKCLLVKNIIAKFKNSDLEKLVIFMNDSKRLKFLHGEIEKFKGHKFNRKSDDVDENESNFQNLSNFITQSAIYGKMRLFEMNEKIVRACITMVSELVSKE